MSTMGESDETIPMIHPTGWAPASGYSNGVVLSGKLLTLAGQIGWDPRTGEFESDDFVVQTRQTLQNIVELLAAADARPRHLARLTWFVIDRNEYISARKEIGRAYREIVGNHYPPMSVVFVSSLLEERARVEIEATAVLP
ncbi:MAG: RidA family protein [Gemmatimonadaceae bacterium]